MHFTGLLLMLSIAGQVPPGALPAPLNAPPVADPSPTSWACTVETLGSGQDCVFESEVERSTDLAAQEAQNVRFAKELAPGSCARMIRSVIGKSDKKLIDLCQRELAAAAERCGLAGEWPLVDAKGRFAPAARPCYVRLAEVLSRAAFTAAASSRCCQCLAASCRLSAETCYRDVARASPDKAQLACIEGACSQECSGVATRAPEPAPSSSNRPSSSNSNHVIHKL